SSTTNHHYTLSLHDALPISLTPMTASLVMEMFREAGVPPGCVNMVLGSGGQAGERLVNHPAIRAVSFTGSNEVGSRLYAQGAHRDRKSTRLNSSHVAISYAV